MGFPFSGLAIDGGETYRPRKGLPREACRQLPGKPFGIVRRRERVERKSWEAQIRFPASSYTEILYTDFGK
jgi:hypothetical protein